jgi:hypothetical protein
VIVRNFVLRDGREDGILVEENVRDVRVEGNDVSGWGSLRKTALDGEGPGWGHRGDAAVDIAPTASRVVVQGNRLHHPRYDTNTWEQDGHPDGPTGIFIERGEVAGNHVIRYNEVYGGDHRYFEDGIMGEDNFGWGGFPGPDSDVYGNYISHVTDNGIEAE